MRRPFAPPIRMLASLGLATVLLAPPASGADPLPDTRAADVRLEVRRAAQERPVRAEASPTTGIAGSPAACADRARTFLGGRWPSAYRWRFRAGSTPDGLQRRATQRVLRRAVANISGVRNDCGRADRVSAAAVFLGGTDRRPGPTARGECGPRDGVNVVGFGRLPNGIAALTCVWSIGEEIVEADIKLDARASWATSLTTCRGASSMVEAVATHEFGHVFGLGHVSEATHERLTMSRRLDGHCQNSESTLRLGDMIGLEALY